MNEEIIRLREAGMSYRALADKFGCSDRTIGRWLRDNGIKPKPRHVPPASIARRASHRPELDDDSDSIRQAAMVQQRHEWEMR